MALYHKGIRHLQFHVIFSSLVEIKLHTVSFLFLKTKFHYKGHSTLKLVAQAGLIFMIFLPQPPDCWNSRHVPSYLVTYSGSRGRY